MGWQGTRSPHACLAGLAQWIKCLLNHLQLQVIKQAPGDQS